MSTTVLQRPAAEAAVGMPSLSVLVPVRNEGRHLAATLSELLAQDYPTDRYEILVADVLAADVRTDVPSRGVPSAGDQGHREPLLYFRGSYARLPAHIAERAAAGDEPVR